MGRSAVLLFALIAVVVARFLARESVVVARFLARESSLLVIAFFGGIALIAAGTALIYLPAGLIVAGLMLVACSVMYVRTKLGRAAAP